MIRAEALLGDRSWREPTSPIPWDTTWLDSKTGVAIHERHGSEPPVVLLHCIGLDSGIWWRMLERMPPGNAIYAVDIPGHGDSIAPFPDDLETTAESLTSSISRANLSKAVLAGISMGGMLAQIIALESPALVGALVLGDTTNRHSPTQAQMLLERSSEVSRQGVAATIPSTLDRWFTRDFRDKNPRLAESVAEHLGTIDPSDHARAWRAISQLQIGHALARVSAPTEVICGALDTATPPSVCRDMAHLVCGATYREIDGAAHISVLERPDAWASSIERLSSMLQEESTG